VKMGEHTSGPASSLAPMHTQDASTVHDDEQPSPLSTLPSSQASRGSRKLSPQVLFTARLQRKLLEALQPEKLEYDLTTTFTKLPG
jgi:hypothetical protein